MTLLGQTVLITGGAVRLGAAMAGALAAEGACPVIQYCRSKTAAQKLVRRLHSEYGVTATAIPGELRTETQCRTLIRRAITATGRLDGLINNAAVFHKDGLRDAGRSKLDAEFRTNLLAPIYLTREFAARAEGGSVINLLDRRIAGYETGCLPYLLSKKALAEFTRIAALELAPRFRVNGIAPGAVLAPPGHPARRIRELAGPVPLEIQVSPADVAAAAIYLLKSHSVTGQVIFVDGGQHLL